LFGRYERAVVSQIFALSPSRVAYDVGAHVGYLTLAFAACAGREGAVFAFEPDPGNRALMEQLVSQNKLGQVVRVVPLALGSANGQEKFFVGESSSLGFLESALDGQHVAGRLRVEVRTTTLDTFVFEESNPGPEIMKIDVEGAEAQVLEGGMRTLETFSPALLIEIHGPNNARKCWGLLQGLGYTWQRLAPQGREPVSSESRLLSYFSRDAWTHHFVLTKLESGVP